MKELILIFAAAFLTGACASGRPARGSPDFPERYASSSDCMETPGAYHGVLSRCWGDGFVCFTARTVEGEDLVACVPEDYLRSTAVEATEEARLARAILEGVPTKGVSLVQ